MLPLAHPFTGLVTWAAVDLSDNSGMLVALSGSVEVNGASGENVLVGVFPTMCDPTENVTLSFASYGDCGDVIYISGDGLVRVTLGTDADCDPQRSVSFGAVSYRVSESSGTIADQSAPGGICEEYPGATFVDSSVLCVLCK